MKAASRKFPVVEKQTSSLTDKAKNLSNAISNSIIASEVNKTDALFRNTYSSGDNELPQSVPILLTFWSVFCKTVLPNRNFDLNNSKDSPGSDTKSKQVNLEAKRLTAKMTNSSDKCFNIFRSTNSS